MRGAGPAVSTAFRLGEETGRGVCWGLQRRAAVVQPERSSGVAFSPLKSGTRRLVGWLVSPLIFSYVLLFHLSPEGFFSAPPSPSRPWEQHWVPHSSLCLFPLKGCSLNTDQQIYQCKQKVRGA